METNPLRDQEEATLSSAEQFSRLDQFSSPELYEKSIDDLKLRAGSLEKGIESTSDPEGFRDQLREVFFKHAGRLRKYALLGSLLALPVFASGSNTEESELVDSIEQIQDKYRFAANEEMAEQMKVEEGVMVYGSRDDETNTLLNYMTGHDVPYNDFLQYIYPHNSELILTDVIMPKLDEAQLRELEGLLETGDQEVVNQWVHELDLKQLSLGDFDSSAYQALWEMHGHYDSPNVEVQNNPLLSKSFDQRAHYSHNEINLPTGFINNSDQLKRSYFAELSHHVQYSQKFGESSFKLTFDIIRTALRGIIQQRSYEDSQLGEYDREGSVEYEAHSEIQPVLEGEYIKRIRAQINLDSISKVKDFYEQATLLDENSEAIDMMIEESRQALLNMKINEENLSDARRLLEFADWRGYDKELREDIYSRPAIRDFISNSLSKYNLDLNKLDEWGSRHNDLAWFIPESIANNS